MFLLSAVTATLTIVLNCDELRDLMTGNGGKRKLEKINGKILRKRGLKIGDTTQKR